MRGPLKSILKLSKKRSNRSEKFWAEPGDVGIFMGDFGETVFGPNPG